MNPAANSAPILHNSSNNKDSDIQEKQKGLPIPKSKKKIKRPVSPLPGASAPSDSATGTRPRRAAQAPQPQPQAQAQPQAQLQSQLPGGNQDIDESEEKPNYPFQAQGGVGAFMRGDPHGGGKPGTRKRADCLAPLPQQMRFVANDTGKVALGNYIAKVSQFDFGNIVLEEPPLARHAKSKSSQRFVLEAVAKKYTSINKEKQLNNVLKRIDDTVLIYIYPQTMNKIVNHIKAYGETSRMWNILVSYNPDTTTSLADYVNSVSTLQGPKVQGPKVQGPKTQ